MVVIKKCDHCGIDDQTIGVKVETRPVYLNEVTISRFQLCEKCEAEYKTILMKFFNFKVDSQ